MFQKILYVSRFDFTVALNYQTDGQMMDFYRGKFMDNGNCGYLLKPSFMRDGRWSVFRIGFSVRTYVRIYVNCSYIYITHYVLEPVDCKVGLFATVCFWNFVFVFSFFSYGRVYLMFYVMAPG